MSFDWSCCHTSKIWLAACMIQFLHVIQKGQSENDQLLFLALHNHYICLHNYLCTYRNRAFRFSGNSVLPAYPGFIVMKSPTVGVRLISVPSNRNLSFLSRIASWMLFTCIVYGTLNLNGHHIRGA